MRVRLNLATKPLESQRRFLVLSGFTGAVALMAFLFLGWHSYSARKAIERLRVEREKVLAETAALQKQRAELERFFAQPENAKLEERSAFLNNIIDEQSFNWTQMFMDLEKVLPAGAHVLTIAPRHETNGVRIKLSVGAVNEEAKLKFIKALEESPEFKSFQLEGVKNINPQQATTTMDRMVLELTVEYARS